MSDPLTFDDLAEKGTLTPFYGVVQSKTHSVNDQILLGSRVFDAQYNPDDGYRTSCDGVVEKLDFAVVRPKKPLARVRVEKTAHTHVDGWQLRDENGHIWLVVGTNSSDSYYPAYEFQYTPKKPRVCPACGHKET